MIIKKNITKIHNFIVKKVLAQVTFPKYFIKLMITLSMAHVRKLFIECSLATWSFGNEI